MKGHLIQAHSAPEMYMVCEAAQHGENSARDFYYCWPQGVNGVQVYLMAGIPIFSLVLDDADEEELVGISVLGHCRIPLFQSSYLGSGWWL